MAPSFAVLSYVSQNVGAGNLKRAGKSVATGIFITAVLGISFGALSAFLSRPLSSLMTNDPVAIAFSREKMLLISTTYFLCGINENLCAALRGMGRATLVTTVAIILMCFTRFLWVYLIYPMNQTITFLYLIWPISWTLSIIALLAFYISTLRNRTAEHHSCGFVS